jgi:hypothetical protein
MILYPGRRSALGRAVGHSLSVSRFSFLYCLSKMFDLYTLHAHT